MGDYVLESNPALERLMERCRSQSEPPPPEQDPRPNGAAKRSRRGRRSKVHPASHPVPPPADPTPGGEEDPAERVIAAERAVAAEDDRAPVGVDPGIIPDEMILVDFDEEPEIIDEDLWESDEDNDEADETDEILDVYEDEEWDGEKDAACEDEEAFAEEVDVLDEDEEACIEEIAPGKDANARDGAKAEDGRVGDEDRELVGEHVEVVADIRRRDSDWIFEAFEVWKEEAVEREVLPEAEGLEIDDEHDADADADEFTNALEDDSGNPVQLAGPPLEQDEVLLVAQEPDVEPDQSCQSTHPAASWSSTVNKGRKKPRHKKQSRRQRKRSGRKAQPTARKTQKPSRNAGVRSSKKPA